MNIVSTKVDVTEQADRVAKTEVLDEEGAVLWLWDVQDLHDILLFHPDLVTFDESDTGGMEPALRRVRAVAGQPIHSGRDLLLSTAPTGLAAALTATDMGLLITNTQQGRRDVEDCEFDRPCLNLDLYEPMQGRAAAPACERDASSAITYAYLAGDHSTAVCSVVNAFDAAFGGKAVAELLIYADEPTSIRSLIDETRRQEAPGHVRIEHRSQLSPLSGRDGWPFDVLIIDDAPGRIQPIAFEAALRGKQTIAIPPGGASEVTSAAEGDAGFALAGEMLLAARRLGAGGPGAECGTAAFARAPAPARLARRLRWITQAPLGELQSDGLSGVGWVTRWNVKCGIGDHAAHQIAAAPGRHVVLAAKEEPLLAEDGPNVFRCWTNRLAKNGLEEAAAVVYRERLASVVIHFNWAFYHPVELLQFVRSVQEGGRVVLIDLHSTTSEGAPHGQRLEHFSEVFTACDRVLVHQPADAERVRSVSPDARVAVEPLGITLRDVPRVETGRPGPPLIACFGFCLPKKGIEELVLATWMLRQSQEDVRLLLLNAEHPAPQSRQTIEEVRELISRLELSDAVTFVTDYLEETKCMDMLSQCSLIVNPYQQTGESASAAVRFAMSSTVPVLVTPLPIFDDLGGAVFRAGGTSPAELAKAIRSALTEVTTNSRPAADVEEAASKWREGHDLRVQTARIIGIGESIRRNRRAEDWLRVGAC